ncbi:MAG: hypothetical protein WA828_09925 [Coleofasciculaceae cyanobacterium]
MQLPKIAFFLTIATILMGCNARFSPEKEKAAAADVSQVIISTPLKSAIEELRVMKIKIESTEGINHKEYGEDLEDLVNIVDKAYGDPKLLSAVKSAVEGHKLAYQFGRCNAVDGYDELYQCRDQVLKKVFVKYPDLAAQAQSAVDGNSLDYISAGLEEKSVLQVIWQKTAKDTETALEIISPTATK